MQTFFYEGRIDPDAVPLTLDYSPCIVRQETENDPKAEFQATVMAGRFRVRVTTEAVGEAAYDGLFVPAWDLVRSLIEMAGYVRAIPYSATIERVILPDGRVQQVAFGDRSLARTHDFDMGDLEALVDLTSLDLKHALLIGDILMTLGKAHYSPIACGRVADGIARLVAPDDNRTAQWQAVRECLRIDEEFLRSLTDVSRGSRHADREEVVAELNQETAHRAWALVGRYLRFRLNGSLDPTKYPLLTGSQSGQWDAEN